MFVRVCAFVIWALVAASAVYWGLRLIVQAPGAPSHAVPVASTVAVRGDLSRLLGAAPSAKAAETINPEVSTRFRLLGVMAPKAGPKAGLEGSGVALIAVDGKPPKAFVVGSSLDADLVLQSVSLRSASIGPPEGAASVKLEIPPLPTPATGTLPGLESNPVESSLPAAVLPVAPVAPISPPPPTVPPAATSVPPAPVMPRPAAPSRQPQVQVPGQSPPNMVAPAPPPGASLQKRDLGALSR